MGEAAPQSVIRATVPPKQKVAESLHRFPGGSKGGDSSRLMTYAIEALNAGGRGAGLSESGAGIADPHSSTAPRFCRTRHRSWRCPNVVGRCSAANTRPTWRVLSAREQNIEKRPGTGAGGRDSVRRGSRTISTRVSNGKKPTSIATETVTVISPENKAEVQLEGEDLARGQSICARRLPTCRAHGATSGVFWARAEDVCRPGLGSGNRATISMATMYTGMNRARRRSR